MANVKSMAKIKSVASVVSENLSVIEKDIVENHQEYEFFQVYRILDKINACYPVSPRRPARTISVRPELGLGYSQTDISDVIVADKESGYEIITQISGLYGLSSPLPDFYNEELLDSHWDELDAPREFLDIIHSQMLPKLYDAWSLFKFNFNAVENEKSNYWQMLYSLLGVVDHEQNSSLARLKLRYFGLFSKAERSAAGIKVLVEDFLGLDGVKIEEFVMRTVRIPEALCLRLGNSNHQLGETAHLGSYIHDQNNAFRIHTGVIEQQEYFALRNDPDKLETLAQLLITYIKKPLKFDLVFNVQTPVSSMVLGRQWHQLGCDSYLHQEPTTRSIHYALA
ncbi:type VI secretion system baseplate subunit TssG [Bacterioplanoides sp.]|uniref:type VI secretion system baseplate subunit TssG n=1 Tax=Bacterioplanoides sp. TaxID=2066072 RepID=UPI003B003665